MSESIALVAPENLVDVRTGEVLPATPENAADLIVAAREMRNRLLDLVKECEAVLLEASRRQGTKTLHLPSGTATISGGQELAWDMDELARLCPAGLPQERFAELVETIVSFKVNVAVAKQLEAANEEYAAIIRAARSYVEKPFRVSIR